MTDTEKNKIEELRSLGYGYQRIAKEIGMSVNSIRNYCLKQNTVSTCKECGKIIKNLLGKKKKKFCSEKCRYIWWNKHRNELNHKVRNVVICACCGKEFINFSNKRRVYCSINCYNKARCKDGVSNE